MLTKVFFIRDQGNICQTIFNKITSKSNEMIFCICMQPNKCSQIKDYSGILLMVVWFDPLTALTAASMKECWEHGCNPLIIATMHFTSMKMPWITCKSPWNAFHGPWISSHEFSMKMHPLMTREFHIKLVIVCYGPCIVGMRLSWDKNFPWVPTRFISWPLKIFW